MNDGDDVVFGDDNAVTDMDAVIRSFLTKFPKYKNSDVYLSAESYGCALFCFVLFSNLFGLEFLFIICCVLFVCFVLKNRGHYVPLTAKKVLEHNDAGYTPTVNLQGFLVGNPLSSYGTNNDGFMAALFGHGLIKKSIMDKWNSECEGNEEAIAYSTACEILYVKAYMASYDADVYALDFPTCTLDDSDLAEKRDNRKFMTEFRSLFIFFNSFWHAFFLFWKRFWQHQKRRFYLVLMYTLCFLFGNQNKQTSQQTNKPII